MKIKSIGLTAVALSALAVADVHAGSRLLATSGVTQLEGGAGGGLTPWAVISGYAEEGEYSVGAFHTSTDVQDFRLKVNGVSASYDNRFEVSAALQSFEIKGVAGDLRQEIYGAKYRIYGDVIYTALPQFAAGIQYKRLLDGGIAKGALAREFGHILDPALGFEPLALVVQESHVGYGHIEDMTDDTAEPLKSFFRRGIEQPQGLQGFQSLLLVKYNHFRHRHIAGFLIA